MNKRDIQLLNEAAPERALALPDGPIGAQIQGELPGELGEPEDIASLAHDDEMEQMSRMKIVDALQNLHDEAMALVKLHATKADRGEEEDFIDTVNNTVSIQEIVGITKDLEKAFRRLTGER